MTGTAKLNEPQQGIHAGQVFPLWPYPNSLYAKLETPHGPAPGIGFCRQCAPAIGELALEGYGPVTEYETAHQRYHQWFSDGKEVFLRAWLRDALNYEAPEVERLLSMWRNDRG